MKMEQYVVYKNENYYSHNPCVLKLTDGKIFVAFRRAPQRKPYSSHIDSESEAVYVSSCDEGKTWSQPFLIYKGPYGVQDPSIALVSGGMIIANFFEWKVIKQEPFNHTAISTGIVFSNDAGKTWTDTPLRVEIHGYVWNGPTEPIIELPSGELLMPVYATKNWKSFDSLVLRSKDKGCTWNEFSVIGSDVFGNVMFEEPTLTITKTGKILAVMRDDKSGFLWSSYSLDEGKTWSLPVKLDVWGCPANLLTLGDGRILMTYGYRRPPYGVRGCISEDDGKTWNLEDEIIICADGKHGDIGYPSSIELKDGIIMTSYYTHAGDLTENDNPAIFTHISGTRYIAYAKYQI
ncbi:MAG: glycoside hydrolase [bacterium]|nr:glycoside hydrolase [bacterium]